MKKFLLAAIAAISILAGAFAVEGERTPALAAAMYGAGAYTGSNPIGGGNGYISTHGYSQATADYVVTTLSGLQSALSSATSGKVIWIPNGVTIAATSSAPIGTLKAGAVLASNRGQGGVAGGKLSQPNNATSFMTPLIWASSNSVISGLQFVGPGSLTGTAGPRNCAIRGMEGARRIEVENCNIGYFYEGGIYFRSGGMVWDDDSPQGRHWIHHCYIHHVQKHGFGYGVSAEGACSFLVEANIIEHCRHLVMGQAGGVGSYEARYNIFGDADYRAGGTGTWYINHQVDWHGTTNSCAYSLIHHNTFSANDRNELGQTLEAHTNVGVRGPARGYCRVYNNWTKKTGRSGLYSETAPNAFFTPLASGGSPTSSTPASYRMEVYDNWYGSSPPPSTPYTNHAPALSPIGAKSVVAGDTLSFIVSATDSDGDTLAFSTSNLPSGAAFSSSTRTFSWKPDSSQVGTYSKVCFSVSDGSLTESEEIAITVIPLAVGPAPGTDPDVNGDGAVNSLDMVRIGQRWGQTGASGWIPEDVNRDGVVSVLDAALLGQYWTG